ncbi:sigma-70 family RNA polymerase sigma factor [Paenibacillus sp. TSA_86.1]|uniref:sigma-70 family RNA polymerase sigma factor n=1 Tax=Paenibacillus sp. TSA_86.1 TaxID=3415649 RepID=UPI004045BB67
MTTNVRDMTDNEFVTTHQNLVHSACQRYVALLDVIKHSSGADYEDLLQVGMLGLLKSRDRFSTELGFHFSTYAVPMIIGEIRQFLRDNNRVKTSRWIKEQYPRFRKMGLYEEDASTVAAALDIFEKQAKILLEYKPQFRSLSEVLFNDASGNVEVTLLDVLKSDYNLEQDVVNHTIVKDFLDILSERERNIWFEYHQSGNKQSTLSKRYGVSQVQISRILEKIETKAVRFGRMKGYANE